MSGNSELVALPANMVEAYWPPVEAELSDIANKCREAWTSTDILRAVMAGHATLCVAFDDHQPVGFLVFQIAVTEYSRDFHIWAASEKTAARMAEYWQTVRESAKLNNCGAITFASPRRWERALPFLEVGYVYRERIA